MGKTPDKANVTDACKATSSVTVSFAPGKIGMAPDFESGAITCVADGQAKAKGVKEGWVIDRVDGAPFSEGLIHKKIAGAAPYKITFKTPDKANVTDACKATSSVTVSFAPGKIGMAPDFESGTITCVADGQA